MPAIALTTIPPHPTTSDSVTIVAQFEGCVDGSGMTLSGFAFSGHIDYQPICFEPPGGGFGFPVGRLPAGDYTAVVIAGDVTETGAFSVSVASDVASIPTLGSFGLFAVTALIVLSGWIGLFRRQT